MSLVTLSYSQTFVISTPTLGFSQACASEGFNTYNFSFSFYPIQNLGANNQFIVELSDANGDFSSPTVVKTLNNTASPVSSSFNLPTNTYGENYRIRVRSTNPDRVSNPSVSFSAYYAVHNQPYIINSNVSTVYLCTGEIYELSVDDTGTPSSPLYYPNLSYKWYKNFAEIPGEGGSTLLVDEPGTYYSIVDYGSCVMNSYSNMVQFQFEPDIVPEILVSNTFLCPGEQVVLTSSLQNPNYIYKWYKDNNEITNANESSYIATTAGVYHLSIGSNGCLFDSDFVTLDSYDFTTTITTPSPLVLLPGDSQILEAQTTALNPDWQWFLDGVPISGATNSTFTISSIGTYVVAASETTPCSITRSDTLAVVFPDAFDALVTTSPDYLACQSTSTVLSLSTFQTEINSTIVDLIPSVGVYTFQWYKNNQLITGATQSTLALNSASENGNYQLAISYPNLPTQYSNIITVSLDLGPLVIESDTELCQGGTVMLTSSITNSAYSYQWYLDGVAITGATTSSYEASIEGNYHLIVLCGACSATSNLLELEISTVTITNHSPTNVVLLPGQTEELSIVTTATNPQYTWYFNNVIIPGANQSTLDVDAPGTYKVVVSENLVCYQEVELVYQVEYPTDFAVQITTNTYTPCQDAPVQLSLLTLTTVINGVTVTIPQSSSFNYQWYVDGGLLSGAALPYYEVTSATQNGSYHLEVELPGLGGRISNAITIELFELTAVTITPDGPFCTPTSVVEISSSEQSTAYNYQWYLDNQVITGATSPTYTATAEGNYFLEITSGSCVISSNPVALTLGVLDVISSSNPTVVLIPGQTEQLFINTNAINPTYTWFLNNVVIPSATNNSLVVDTPGTYKVEVVQTDACNTTVEMEFQVVYPSDFSATIATDDSYEMCQNTSVLLALDSLETILNSNTVTIPVSTSFTFQWYFNGSPILGANAENLMLSNDNQNGNYQLEVTIPGVGTMMSNVVSIVLFTPSIPEISASSVLCPNSSITLSCAVNQSYYSYQWFLDGVVIAGATDSTYEASLTGTYEVEVSLGSCLIQSNPFPVVSYDFDLNPISPIQDILLPGDSKLLSIASSALAPQIVWFKDNVLITDASGLSYLATEAGLYRVEVTQTQNCVFTKILEFELNYPMSISATISADTAYQACVSTSSILSLDTFLAYSTLGNIDLLGNTLGYSYQWFKDGNPIAGATNDQLFLSQFSDNGMYHLEIIIPDFGTLVTNTITIQFPVISNVTITGDGFLCEANTTIVLSTTFNEPTAIYEWFSESSSTVLGTGMTLAVSQPGDYFLVVTYAGCTLVSNTISITNFDASQLVVNQNNTITIDEGDTVVIEASGADSYTWYFNGVQISSMESIVVSEPGIYTLQATLGNCQITKEFLLVVIENNVQAIPNIVTPNNDGFNDLWKLPSKYNRDNVEIAIYDGSGNIVLQTRSYQNDWPNESTVLSTKSLVFYYTITEDFEITKKGTITVVK